MARPIEFDRTSVLQKAMGAFWEHGYCATSVADLVATTGLNPGSLYAAFASKEGLLLATLAFYGQRSLVKAQQCLRDAATPLDGIRHFFAQLASERNAATRRRGCFLVNTALEVAPHNDAVRAQVKAHLDAIEAVFAQALRNAQQDGSIPAGEDPRALAQYLMVTIWGIRVLQRLDADPAGITTTIEHALRALQRAAPGS